MKKAAKRRKTILIIVVCIIVISMAFAYVIPLAGWAETQPPETPPPDNGTDWGLDDSTLPPMPYDEEDDEEEELPPPVLKILSERVRLNIGESVQIYYEMENFPDGTMIEWSSGNPNVAVISADGRVLAVAPGSADIIATAGQIRASVLVTVNELKAERIAIIVGESVNKTGTNSYELKVGDVERFSAKIIPEGAKVDKITWELGNKDVATLTPNGQFCGFVADAKGRTTVTVKADGLEGSIAIEIKESGVPVDTLWEYIKIGVVIVVVIVAIAVMLTWLANRRKKEAEQRKAAAKRRRIEAERRALKEAAQPDTHGPYQEQSEERATMKVTGAAVGAGLHKYKDWQEEPERPVTLDDLD